MNQLYNTLGGGMPQNPMGMIMNRFNQFRQSFRGIRRRLFNSY